MVKNTAVHVVTQMENIIKHAPYTQIQYSVYIIIYVHNRHSTLTGSVSSSTLALYVMGLQSRVFPTSVQGRNMGPKSSPSSTSTVRVVVAVRRSLG